MQDRLVMLVVDDVEVNRGSMRAMFSEEYEIIEAENGQDAMDILHQEKVDVVILDVFMPILDGAGMLEQMKADNALRDIPVIVKTAIDENMEVTMLEKGADDFIFSPCEPAIIKNRVRNIVQKYVFRQVMLQKKIEEEQHLSRVRENFISRVSNGMKQDIACIQKLCISKDGMEGSEKECLKEIEAHASHLMTTVEEMLGQAKLEHEEQMLHLFPFQLRGVITELTREYMVICQNKKIDFTMKNCEIPYDDLVGDGKRLKQVWSRMLKNVYDNTPPGGSISTSYLQRKIGKGNVELEITVRGNIDPNNEYPIAKSIVELLRGSMIVEDEEGRGIISVITLPFKIGKAPMLRQKKLGNMCAMVVDDNELTRQYHAAILTRLGVTCDTAVNGAGAMDLLHKAYVRGKTYDICLLNWYMLGAKDAIREMRSIFPAESMVIACSTNEKEQVEDEMKLAGVDYVVERPIYQSDLYHLLKDICNGGESAIKAE